MSISAKIYRLSKYDIYWNTVASSIWKHSGRNRNTQLQAMVLSLPINYITFSFLQSTYTILDWYNRFLMAFTFSRKNQPLKIYEWGETVDLVGQMAKLARNNDNVAEWSDMSTCELLFQWTSNLKIKSNVLV